MSRQLTNDENAVDTDKDFHHPYHPYDIQREFMSALYNCLQEGKIGIFESPTGTGKSLSLICGSLTWLRDHKRQLFEEGLQTEIPDDDEPVWMLEHARNEKREAALRSREALEERLAKIRAQERKLKERHQNTEPSRKRQKRPESDQNDTETQFLLDDYQSDQESGPDIVSGSEYPMELNLSTETQVLMKKLGISYGPRNEEEETPGFDEIKIFFCSRTHSQLSQFAGELRKVNIPSTLAPFRKNDSEGGPSLELEEHLKHLALGSRKNLCINKKVSRLGDPTAINERCLELQRTGKSSDAKCPYLPVKDMDVEMNDFRDRALAEIRDIEDFGKLGQDIGICPYYASRHVFKYSEIVTLPYPLLLQKSAREALDISLKGHIVIVDEAHNLMDAINGIYSTSVSLSQMKKGRAQLGIYLQKFRNRLKGKNRVYVTQTARLFDSLINFLQEKESGKDNEGKVQIQDLMTGKGMDQVNLYKLMRYLQQSKLARKVDGYITFSSEDAKEGKKNGPERNPLTVKTSSIPVITHIQGFLYALMSPSSEGQFFYSRNNIDDVTLKYLLVDPTYHFKEIVEDARAVVLAGGTMSPMSDYVDHLLGYLPRSRITTLSCGHVIPPSNLLAMPITTSGGSNFNFTFDRRGSEKMVNQLGYAILDVISHIPDGVVVFFPSHSYLESCVTTWRSCRDTRPGSTGAIWESLISKKPVFLESKSSISAKSTTTSSTASTITHSQSSVDSLLSSYSNAIASNQGRGALLLAVIGGTLSEGINFSDSLGRGVIVVGLPFPNPHSAEWKAKMNYISQKATTIAKNPNAGKIAAREFYENACMRAVNQCIGRAIRHREDYAAILMIDQRYGDERIQQKLPGWIRGSMKPALGINDTITELRRFFEEKIK